MEIGRMGRWALAAVAGLISVAACAQPVAVKDAWIRAPVAGQKVAGAYMELTSRGGTAILLSVASPVAGRVELHDSSMDGGVMKMREVERVELAGGRPVRFEPGRLHVMLIDLKRPLKPGDKVPLILRVELPNTTRSTFTVQAEVRAEASAGGHHYH